MMGYNLSGASRQLPYQGSWHREAMTERLYGVKFYNWYTRLAFSAVCRNTSSAETPLTCAMYSPT